MKGIRPGAWTEARVEEELSRPGSIVRLLERSGEPVAAGFGRVVVDELHVLDVATAPERRRRGAGSAVLRALIAAGAAAGCARVLLELRASNGAAEHLYRAAGFVVVGRRPRYYPDGEDATLMTLTLSAAPESAP